MKTYYYPVIQTLFHSQLPNLKASMCPAIMNVRATLKCIIYLIWKGNLTSPNIEKHKHKANQYDINWITAYIQAVYSYLIF